MATSKKTPKKKAATKTAPKKKILPKKELSNLSLLICFYFRGQGYNHTMAISSDQPAESFLDEIKKSCFSSFEAEQFKEDETQPTHEDILIMSVFEIM